MIDWLLALTVSFLVIVVVTRISYSLLGAAIVTAMISVAALRVHTHPVLLVASLVSFFVGWHVARKKSVKK